MLVLTRKSEESVMIGEDIEVRVLGIHGDQVRLGFSAPNRVPVFRKEVFEAIQAENRCAAQRSVSDMQAITGVFRQSVAEK